jgi:hypothetical protein
MAVNAIAEAFGLASSITGGALASVFCARQTVAQNENSATQHKNRSTTSEDIYSLLLLTRAIAIRRSHTTAKCLRVYPNRRQ